MSKTVYDGHTISLFEFSPHWQLNVVLNLPDLEHLTASKWQTAVWQHNFGLYQYFLLYITSRLELWAQVSTVTIIINLDDFPTTLQNADLVTHGTMKKCISWVGLSVYFVFLLKLLDGFTLRHFKDFFLKKL